MSKKSLLVLAMTLSMVAILAIGGTLAYFTDTESATNTFTVGNVKIKLVEKNEDGSDFTQKQVLMPGSKTENNIAKIVSVNNVGDNAAYMWIEVWVPSALDDGDDNSPQAPGLGNSLHFNYNSTAGVVETKSTFLGSKEIDGVYYNGYVHYDKNQEGIAKDGSTIALLDQVYMDSKITQCTDTEHEHGNKTGLILVDGTCYTGNWNLVINAIGIQSEGIATITDAITTYYEKDVTAHIW